MKKSMLAATLMLGGCLSVPESAAPPLEVIEYRTSACFGACAVYHIAVSSDGVVAWEGIQNVATPGRRQFVIQPREWEAFKAALAPYRPEGTQVYGSTPETCDGPIATDAPGVEIRWRDDDRDDYLNAYFGCNLDVNRPLYQALADAPDRLPLSLYIGR